MRGAVTHRASRREGATGGALQETVHDAPAQIVTHSGRHIECSPRRNPARNGQEECHGQVDDWQESVARQRAH